MKYLQQQTNPTYRTAVNLCNAKKGYNSGIICYCVLILFVQWQQPVITWLL